MVDFGSVKNVVKPNKVIVSKLKRFDIPASASDSQAGHVDRNLERYVKAWEKSKSKVEHLASFVNQRTSAYSAWLQRNNLSSTEQGGTTHAQLLKSFNAQVKATVVSTPDDPMGDYYLTVSVRSTDNHCGRRYLIQSLQSLRSSIFRH